MRKDEFDLMAKVSDEIVAKARTDKAFAKQFLRELGLVDPKGQLTKPYRMISYVKTAQIQP
ncbi:hypothetical protein D5085_10820 [Ectothiorhodospiraceae bacterium BW-2]|nr:hypothetical protein D5085_10820 [Ectothiorhodospiraceae bacterium BW-2]